MGLDMNLMTADPSIDKDQFFSYDSKKLGIKHVAYWRKANQIHRYFCTVGICLEPDVLYRISGKDILNLLDKCVQVLKEPRKAKEILPTQEGFFFGSTNYDNYYFYGIAETLEQMSKLFFDYSPKEFEKTNFLYYASW